MELISELRMLLKEFQEVIKLMENSLHWKEMQAGETKIFPPCNSEWRKDSGGRVWCSKKRYLKFHVDIYSFLQCSWSISVSTP